MRGDLSETSVADLCRGLSDAEATGAVELDGPEGAARVFFRRGNVYWAMSPAPRARLGDRLVNGGLLTSEQLESTLAAQRESSERLKLGAILVDRGLVSRDVIRVFVQEQILDALFDLMRWRRGSYVFRGGDAVSEKLPIDIPVDQLLVEVSRRQSEWDQIEAAIPHLDMVPDFVVGGSSANAALEPDEFAVLASVDGRRSIRELADALGYSHFEAARIIYGLTLLGIVDVTEEVEPEDLGALYDEVSAAADSPLSTDGEPQPDDADTRSSGTAPAGSQGLDGADVPAEDLDLELELSDLAEDDDLDIAAALEEALGLSGPSDRPSSDEPPAKRPSVRVHVDDDLTDYAAPRQVTDTGLAPTGEPRRTDVPLPPAPPPSSSAPASDIAEQDEEDLTSALADALDAAAGSDLDDETSAPPPGDDEDRGEGSAPRAAPADEPDEPSTAQAPEDPGERAPTDEPADTASVGTDESLFEGIETEADGPTGEVTPAADEPDPLTDDSDFDALIDQLAGGPGSDDADRDGSPTASPDESAEPTPAAASEPSPERSTGTGDVSEFLRELSRLALDDPSDGSPSEPTEEDDGPETSEADAASDAAARSREAQRAATRNEAEDKKKRGLFGWGR